MKKKVYLVLMILSVVIIIFCLLSIFWRNDDNSVDSDQQHRDISNFEDPDQSGYLNEFNDNIKKEHCTDRICTKIRGVSKNRISSEFVVEVINKTSIKIGMGGVKLVSVDNEDLYTTYIYDSIEPNQTFVGVCQHDLDDYLNMSDYYIVELDKEETEALLNG